ncbi:STAS domain-containing protein [Brumimicrobium mesophilum]|uniref:STAS domain-containing protein n=1 Tax=Brumimicrobium mesophilum TaxID=392717 RepID=UPI00131BECD7|nr:STAS domain-containing protein [Brumimicrobium mesophilum]
MSFSIQLDIQSTVCILDFSGTILTKNKVDETLEMVDFELEDGKRKFIIDLKELKQINSSGLNLILRIFTHIRNKGGELILVQPNKSVSEIFKISKLNTVFNISADKQTAINQLNAPEA